MEAKAKAILAASALFAHAAIALASTSLTQGETPADRIASSAQDEQPPQTRSVPPLGNDQISKGRPQAQHTAILSIKADGLSTRDVRIHEELRASDQNQGRTRFFHTPTLLISPPSRNTETNPIPLWVYRQITRSDGTAGFVVRVQASSNECVDAAHSAVLHARNDLQPGDVYFEPWPVLSASATLLNLLAEPDDDDYVLATGKARSPGGSDWQFLIFCEPGVTPEQIYALNADHLQLSLVYTYEGAEASSASVRIEGKIDVEKIVDSELASHGDGREGEQDLFQTDRSRIVDAIRTSIRTDIITNDLTLLPYLDDFVGNVTDELFASRVIDLANLPTTMTQGARQQLNEYLRATHRELVEEGKEWDETTVTDEKKVTISLDTPQGKEPLPSLALDLEDMKKTEHKYGVDFTTTDTTDEYIPKTVNVHSIVEGQGVIELSDIARITLSQGTGVYPSRVQPIRVASELVGQATFEGTFALYVCEPCDGRGFKVCESCDGHGDTVCSKCNGKAFTVDHEVNLPSLERVACRFCGGNGITSQSSRPQNDDFGAQGIIGLRFINLHSQKLPGGQFVAHTTSKCPFCAATGTGAMRPTTVPTMLPRPCSHQTCRGGWQSCSYTIRPPGDQFARCKNGFRTCQACRGDGRRRGSPLGAVALPLPGEGGR